MGGARRFFSPIFIAITLIVGLWPGDATADRSWLDKHDGSGLAFKEIAISDDILVFYHQRRIGDAIVERDRIIYKFDRRTGEFLEKISHWRDDLPESLPSLAIDRERARFLAEGDVQAANLTYISPESDVFPLDPPPVNPCWVVRGMKGDWPVVTLIDAVTGRRLGFGVPPPYVAYSMTGPQEDAPCGGAWTSWAESAEYWFEVMGYSTQMTVWPDKAEIQSHVGSFETALFYELAHGASAYFSNDCGAGYVNTTASDIASWIDGYPKMPFAFIGSCEGLCQTGPGTFSYEFRKGSAQQAVAIGYCGMADPECADCWGWSLSWQNALFSYVSSGYTVKQAFDLANADYPTCAEWGCMQFVGDESLALVPQVVRTEWAALGDATSGPLGDVESGRGAAWLDYDGDGDQDLYVVNHGQANVLLRNDGAGVFADVTAGPLGDAGLGNGTACADYDNDGDLDLYIANAGQSNVLLCNEGAGIFSDATVWPVDDAGQGCGVAWADYNNDGLVDLYLVNEGSANKLFVGYGDLGGGYWVFVPSSDVAIGDAGNGSCAAWADYDNDGDQDVYLVNRYENNRLLQNNFPGGFVDVAGGTLLADNGNGTGCAWGDYDNDGDLDLYLANDGRPNVLFKNTGGTFTVVNKYPLNESAPCRGVAWSDYDNDGDLDLYLARHGMADLLLRNDGDDQFHEQFVPGSTGNSNGVTLSDYDGDGDLDFYLTCDGGNMLLANTSATGNHWLHVDLVGVDANRAAIGARVRIVAGGLEQIREVTSGSGFMSQSTLTVEFGLGAATLVDTLEIQWPGGGRQRETDLAAGQRLTVQQVNLTDVAPPDPAPGGIVLHQASPNPFNPATVIRFDLPAPSLVRLHVYDASGRVVRTLLDAVPQQAGRREVRWDGKDDGGRAVASGTYFYRLSAGGQSVNGRMVLVR